jgi:hypothetical protein
MMFNIFAIYLFPVFPFIYLFIHLLIPYLLFLLTRVIHRFVTLFHIIGNQSSANSLNEIKVYS